MNSALFQSLIWQSLSDPARAATTIIGWKLPRNILWSSFVLVIILNVLSAVLLTPPPPQELLDAPEMAALLRLISQPVLMAIVSGGMLVIVVFLLDWVGKIMGGKSELGDILTAVVWVQMLTFLARLLMIAVLYIAPALAGLVMFAIWGLSLWIFLHFLRVAHQFANIGQAFATLLLTVFGLAFGTLTFLRVIATLFKGFAG